MLKTPSPYRLLLSLGLVLLLAAWSACKGSPEQEETAAKTDETEVTAPAQPPAAASSPTGAGQTGTDPAKPVMPPASAVLTPKDLPKVVARVNGEEIKKEILLQGAQVVQIRMAQMGRRPTPSAAFYRGVLNELIAITLLQQDAKAQGMAPSEQEVEQQIQARKKAFPSEDAFQKALAQSGVTVEMLRQQARDQIAVQKYVQTKLAPNVNVSDQAAREFYEKNKAQIHPPERLHLRHILVTVDPKASPADKAKAREKADGLLKRLQAGEDFARLAQESSDDTGSKPAGGDLGWIVRGQTVPGFEKAAFALTRPNELSPVVESPFGFHIIQLLERQKPGTVPYEQVKDRIMAMLKQQQAQKQVEARVRELREKGKIETFI
ncbi:MAG TPA: peptidylprolyl isomerase [Thermoanaerobaculia bacterium]|jgi:peptidyl-prolyl cis-trans isomerase C|nr:peptidylprolyl isomerase [Thermoanaerobaculia bacterium]